MKALKTTISLTELQKIVRMWRNRNITDSYIPKLMELYTGQTAYMNQAGEYPIENFYDLCISLRFKNTAHMIRLVKQCGSFHILHADNTYTMSAFCSPVWKTEYLTSDSGSDSAETHRSAGALPGDLPMDTIYNNISKESPSSKEASPDGDAPQKTVSQKENKTTTESLAAAKEFFHLINEDAAQKAQILTPLIDRFQKEEDLSRPHACENLVCLVNDLLIPYFAMQARFMKSNHIGRICWLNNLLKSAHGGHLINEAAQACRKKREQTRQENRSNQRSNRPLSPFEWTDPETGLRFYDDDIEGMVSIPPCALPRPSVTAIWNVLSQNWINPSVP